MSDPGPASTTTASTVPLPDASAAPAPSTDPAAPLPPRPPDVPQPPVGAQSRGTGRAVTAVICLVLAALLTTPAAIAYWGHRTLTDAQRYVQTVGPLIEQPQVQDALATAVVAAVDEQVDVEALVEDVFGDVVADRPRLQRLSGPLDAAINGLVDRLVRELLASDAFDDVWLTMNARAQQALIRLLEGGDGGAVQLQGDQVVLDLGEVISEVQDRLVARGLTILENVTIPDVDRQIVLLDAPQLQRARTIYAFANPVAQWLIVVVALLFLAALLLARNRPRMTVIIGVVLVANAVLVALALSVGRQLFINALADSQLGPASAVFYDTLLAYLERGWRVVLWLGLILVVVGWYLGTTRPATAVRGTVTAALESAGSGLAGTPVAGVGRWVGANVRWLRIVVVVLAAVVMLWGIDVSVARLWWSVVLAVALLAAVQVLVGTARAESSSGPSTGPPTESSSAPPAVPVA